MLKSRFSFLSGRSLTQVLLFLLIVGLCIANGLLIKQNRGLKAAIARGGKPTEFLEPGEAVPPFAAKTLSGQRQVVNYTNHPKTVLLAFSSQCDACKRMVPYWKEIEAACARNKYQILGISLDNDPDTNEFLKQNGINVEELVGSDVETKRAYKLNGTPLTIVIDSKGRVEKVWPGGFSRDTKLDVEGYFGITLGNEVR